MVAAAIPAHLAGRPRLRGVFHLGAFWVTLGLAATMITLAAVEGGRAATAASIYCGSMACLFGVSALYHRGTWRERGWAIMRRVDHATIFVFIAGTYTPFGLMALGGAARWWVLGSVWTGCAAGIVLKIGWPDAPRSATVPLYLLVGWAAVPVVADISANVGVASLVLLLVGGGLYTLGAIAYGLRRPDPWPETFGFHEVFHVLTILAAICQYIAVFLTIYRSPFSV